MRALGFFFDSVLDWLGEKLSEAGAIEEAAETAYDVAVDMCGNEGQVSIIDMMSVDAFYQAAEVATNNIDPYEVLIAACPYPEAVGDILSEAAAVIEEILEDARGTLQEEAADGDNFYDEETAAAFDSW